MVDNSGSVMVKIILSMEEEAINEFRELRQFWYNDEDGNLIKPRIAETLRRYIIDCINDNRIEVAQSEATENTELIEESHIPIVEVPLPESIPK